MSPAKRLHMFALVILLLAMHTFAQHPQHPSDGKNAVPTMNATEILASAKADIDHANSDWVPALRRRDAAAIAAAYTDGGLFIAPDGTFTHGRAAITAMYAARFPNMGEIRDGGVVQDGTAVIDAATIYEWGHAWLEREPATPGQPPTRSGGKYLTVWQHSSDGHWRITRNIAF